MKKADIKASEQITFSFLQDVKHKIFFPKTITIKDTKKNIIKVLDVLRTEETLNKKEFIVTLQIPYDDEQLTDEFIIIIEKKNNRDKNTLVIDEINFN